MKFLNRNVGKIGVGAELEGFPLISALWVTLTLSITPTFSHSEKHPKFNYYEYLSTTSKV